MSMNIMNVNMNMNLFQCFSLLYCFFFDSSLISCCCQVVMFSKRFIWIVFVFVFFNNFTTERTDNQTFRGGGFIVSVIQNSWFVLQSLCGYAAERLTDWLAKSIDRYFGLKQKKYFRCLSFCLKRNMCCLYTRGFFFYFVCLFWNFF